MPRGRSSQPRTLRHPLRTMIGSAVEPLGLLLASMKKGDEVNHRRRRLRTGWRRCATASIVVAAVASALFRLRRRPTIGTSMTRRRTTLILRLSSRFGGDSSVREGDRDAGAAEVDHCDQRVGGVESVGAVGEQPDLAV